jgi:hypothetical protein
MGRQTIIGPKTYRDARARRLSVAERKLVLIGEWQAKACCSAAS